MVIQVSNQAYLQLQAEAHAAHPFECCGILLGQGDGITAIQPAANIHPAPETHFEIDPQALINAHRAAREGGPPVAGYYHSHPVGSPQPSATDRQRAAGDGSIWAIVGEAEVKFWRDDPAGFRPLSYQISQA